MADVVRFDGGFVTRQPRRSVFNNLCVPTFSTAAKHWYEVRWNLLVKRLRYSGNKARNARVQILRHWGPKGLAQAEGEARG